jgi:DNA-binding CsgD family transcriptional regulator
MKRVRLHKEVSTPGILLLTDGPSTIAYNWEALQILAFPANPEQIEHIQGFLAMHVRSRLASRRSTDARQFVGEFRSGQRVYTCRTVDLRPANASRGVAGAATALLLERHSSTALFLKRQAWSEFHLTQREYETVEFLVQGMTTKEIAEAMNLSPNTVKSFLRLIMTKMNVPTRSGIIGKILGSTPPKTKVT